MTRLLLFLVAVGLQAQGTLGRPQMDWGAWIALGLDSDLELNTKFGQNPEIDQNPPTFPEDIWAAGGLYTGQPVPCPAETIEVVSSDANDTAAGSGAQTAKLWWLDDTFTEFTETFSLDGATPVVMTAALTGCRASRLKVIKSGATGSNEGVLTVRNTTTTANVYATVAIGANQTQLGAYTIPAGKSGIVKFTHLSIARSSGAAGSARFHLLVREPGEVYQVRKNLELTTGSPISHPSYGTFLPEKTDIIPRILSVSDNDTSVAIEMQYLLSTN